MSTVIPSLPPVTVPLARLHYEAVIPSQGQPSDAGYDLTSITDGIIPAGDRDGFGTGIAVAIPEGYVGYIKPRSGLAANYGIDVLAGVIDSGYRGEIRVILLNTGQDDFTVSAGDRIAQLVIQPVASVAFHEVLLVSELAQSERSGAGFGSTGVR